MPGNSMRCPTVDGTDHEWLAALEWHPVFRLHAALPMEYEAYREQMRELDESPGWELPDLWRGADAPGDADLGETG
jgi:hypothetical protein